MNKTLRLSRILQLLENNSQYAETYIYVPSAWSRPFSPYEYVFVRAKDYYRDVVARILEQARPGVNYATNLSSIQGEADRWSTRAVLYNAFPRLTSAFDHDGNNVIGQSQIDLTLNEKGIRDSGTFLKTIAMLPYIRSLGANTLYLLPVNRIGTTHRKGDLGSPYATADLMDFDPLLADPLLGGMNIADQFAALVEAAHILGIRVVLEFALRTASVDCVQASSHPEWFYWIHRQDADRFEKPCFTPEELQHIRQVPATGREEDYLPPCPDYRQMFTLPPAKGKVKRLKGQPVGQTPEGEAVIPPAFADWPPDDIQPSWDDVTYLRMYRDPKDEYNYMAYNTLRYYDPALAKQENAVRPLWDYLAQVIPTYQKKYGIDGSMIDMGHALPESLVQNIRQEARKIDPTFAFFEENFYPKGQADPQGYDAALGFGFECDLHSLWRMVDYARQDHPEAVFGTLETHNTPRAAARGGARFSLAGYAIFCFLPSVLPMIHSGFELLETFPVNTGLGFTKDQTEFYAREKLPLFYLGALNWLSQDHLTGVLARLNDLRRAHLDLVCDASPQTLDLPHVESPEGAVKAYRRVREDNPHRQIIVLLNTDEASSRKFYLHIPYAGDRKAADVITGFIHTFTSDWLSYEMAPGQAIVLALE